MSLVKSVMIGIIVLFVALMFIVNMTPTLETDVSSANITNTMTSSMIDMSVWIVPVLAIVGCFMGAFGLFRLSKTGNGDG